MRNKRSSKTFRRKAHNYFKCVFVDSYWIMSLLHRISHISLDFNTNQYWLNPIREWDRFVNGLIYFKYWMVYKIDKIDGNFATRMIVERFVEFQSQ